MLPVGDDKVFDHLWSTYLPTWLALGLQHSEGRELFSGYMGMVEAARSQRRSNEAYARMEARLAATAAMSPTAAANGRSPTPLAGVGDTPRPPRPVTATEFIGFLALEDDYLTDRAFRVFDEDGDGQLGFRDFVVSCVNYLLCDEAGALQFCFDVVDAAEEGMVDVSRLHAFTLRVLGGGARADNLWKRMNTTLQGLIKRQAKEKKQKWMIDNLREHMQQRPQGDNDDGDDGTPKANPLTVGIDQGLFYIMARSQQQFLKVTVGLQAKLQEKFLGREWWIAYTGRRIKPFGTPLDERYTPSAFKAGRTRGGSAAAAAGLTDPVRGWMDLDETTGGVITRMRRRAITGKAAKYDVGVEICVLGSLVDRRAALRKLAKDRKRAEAAAAGEADKAKRRAAKRQGKNAVEERGTAYDPDAEWANGMHQQRKDAYRAKRQAKRQKRRRRASQAGYLSPAELKAAEDEDAEDTDEEAGEVGADGDGDGAGAGDGDGGDIDDLADIDPDAVHPAFGLMAGGATITIGAGKVQVDGARRGRRGKGGRRSRAKRRSAPARSVDAAVRGRGGLKVRNFDAIPDGGVDDDDDASDGDAGVLVPEPAAVAAAINVPRAMQARRRRRSSTAAPSAILAGAGRPASAIDDAAAEPARACRRKSSVASEGAASVLSQGRRSSVTMALGPGAQRRAAAAAAAAGVV